MEKELKISELTQIWRTSVPTVWNRVKKEGLQQVKKVDENNKEINYIRISDEILNKYIVKVNNNVNNGVNNGYYEDMLNVDNVNNDIKNHENDYIDAEYTVSKPNQMLEVVNAFTTYNEGSQERLTKVYNDCNKRIEDNNRAHQEEIQNLYKQISDYREKTALLADKAGREGYYLNEINNLKDNYNVLNKDYKGVIKNNEVQKYIIGGLAIVVVGLLTYLITVNNIVKNLSQPVNNVQEQVINDKKPAEVQEVVTPPAPQQVKKVVPRRK